MRRWIRCAPAVPGAEGPGGNPGRRQVSSASASVSRCARRAAVSSAAISTRQLIWLAAAAKKGTCGPSRSAAAAPHPPSTTGPTATQAQKAVAFAYAQLGKPYVWGATGPGSYDCSGLMMAAWAAAGVTIPRDTYSQVAGLPSVPLSSLQPGDLVFFDGDGHVAMHVGGGMIIDAPRTGLTVEKVSLSFSCPGGIGRAERDERPGADELPRGRIRTEIPPSPESMSRDATSTGADARTRPPQPGSPPRTGNAAPV